MLFVRIMAASLVVAVGLVGCSGAHPQASSSIVNVPTQGHAESIQPNIVQGHHPAWPHWESLSVDGTSDLRGATVGPDDEIWAVDHAAQALRQFTMSKNESEISIPSFSPSELTVGADNNFWINSDTQAEILRVTPGGTITAFSLPSNQTAAGGLVLGPDGNVWFTEQTEVASITPTGIITQFSVPSGCGVAGTGIAVGSDNNIWYAASGTGCAEIVKLDPNTAIQTPYAVQPGVCLPIGILAAPDHNLWFSCKSSIGQLGKITTQGAVTTYPVPGPYSASPHNLAAGPGDIFYILDRGTSSLIVRVDPTTLAVKELHPPATFPRLWGIIHAPDGNMWASGGNRMSMYLISPLHVHPGTITFSNPGLFRIIHVFQAGTHKWTAHSTDGSVASVIPGSKPTEFEVDSNQPGQCVINVRDEIGNTFPVPVLVM